MIQSHEHLSRYECLMACTNLATRAHFIAMTDISMLVDCRVAFTALGPYAQDFVLRRTMFVQIPRCHVNVYGKSLCFALQSCILKKITVMT